MVLVLVRLLVMAVDVDVVQRSHRLGHGTYRTGRGMMTGGAATELIQLLLLKLLLFFGRHEQDALRVVALRRSNPRTVRDQLRC